jgi:ABC-2 type transport system ATP-binding protein
MIEAQNLSKRFGPSAAVDGLSLSVKPGEIFALLGPNGAGKTTTVRMLACLIGPSGGTAVVAGHDIQQDPDAVRAHIGILTESPGLYEKLDSEQNLNFYARLYGLPPVQRDRQVRRYLTLLGLWERRAEPVAGFSKGMKQKLAIARALLHEPEVVFLDEPTSALDPESAKVVRDFIAELKSEGRTILLCTHNLDEAERLADRIGVMKQRLIQVGTADSLRRGLYGRQLAVRLRAVSEAHLAAVRALPFARDVQREDNRIMLGLDDPDTMTPLVVRALVEAGAEIQSVTEEKHSLEDVYLSLVHSGAESRS